MRTMDGWASPRLVVLGVAAGVRLCAASQTADEWSNPTEKSVPPRAVLNLSGALMASPLFAERSDFDLERPRRAWLLCKPQGGHGHLIRLQEKAV
jgi:hypothetical protein